MHEVKFQLALLRGNSYVIVRKNDVTIFVKERKVRGDRGCFSEYKTL
jgi:hypothetical protein